MGKITTTFLLCFILAQSFGQKQNKISAYVLAQYNKTVYDRTLGNNPSGIGIGLQGFFTTQTKFEPTLEITGDIYLEDDKIFRVNQDGTIQLPANDVSGMVNLFIGSAFHFTPRIYVSFVAGPSFSNDQALLGIKPSFGFYFSKNQKWTGKASYINIFNRDKITKQDFGSISIAVGLKLF